MGSSLENFLNRNKACKEAKEWVQAAKITSFAQMWDQCKDPAWMLWGLEHAGHWEGPTRLTRRWTHQCLLNVNEFLSDPRSRRALKVLEAYAGGGSSTAELADAYAAASAAVKTRTTADGYARRATPHFHATRAVARALSQRDDDWTTWANESTAYAAMAAAQKETGGTGSDSKPAEACRQCLIANRQKQADILRSVFSADVGALLDNLEQLD